MCKVLNNNHNSFLRYGATCEKNTPTVLVIKSRNSKSYLIFTKTYTDRLTIIRNNYVKFHKIWISVFQVTVRHVDAEKADRQTNGGRTEGRTDRRTDRHLYTISQTDRGRHLYTISPVNFLRAYKNQKI